MVFSLISVYVFTKQENFKLVQIESKITVNEKIAFFFLRRIENIVEKGGNAVYQHFLLFLQCFQKASFSGFLNLGAAW